jgi:hypothetical protein
MSESKTDHLKDDIQVTRNSVRDPARPRAPKSLVYTVIFGVALAMGGSALEPIPLFSVTFASPLVALLVTLDKMIVRTRLSVTGMYAVASPIAIFTTYLGPPSPLKLLFILAGLSFDAATLFRTGTRLKLRHLLLGHIAITITGFFFWVVFAASTPKSAFGAECARATWLKTSQRRHVARRYVGFWTSMSKVMT